MIVQYFSAAHTHYHTAGTERREGSRQKLYCLQESEALLQMGCWQMGHVFEQVLLITECIKIILRKSEVNAMYSELERLFSFL